MSVFAQKPGKLTFPPPFPPKKPGSVVANGDSPAASPAETEKSLNLDRQRFVAGVLPVKFSECSDPKYREDAFSGRCHHLSHCNFLMIYRCKLKVNV